MPTSLQNLDRLQAIVDQLGIPTQYFIRFIQDRGGALTDLEAIIVELQAIVDAFAENEIIAGDVLSGGGKLVDGDVTLDHDTALVAPGTYGDATNVPQITVDEFGHVQLVENIPITGGGGGGGGITAYYAENNASTNIPSPPLSAAAAITANIPASGTARKFAVMGQLTWRTGAHSMRGHVMLDGVVVWPNNIGANPGIDGVASADGVDHLPFGGTIVSVPGDNAAHTISLAWECQGATGAITAENRQIVCIQIDPAGGGGGGSGREAPTFVQMATIRNDGTVTLPSAPTPGNLMVWMAGGWGGSINGYIPAGFTRVATYLSNGNNGVMGAMRVVQPGDTGSYSVSASDNQGGVLYEFSDAVFLVGSGGGYPDYSGSNFNFSAAPSPYQANSISFLPFTHDDGSTLDFTPMTGLTQDYQTVGGGNHASCFARLADTASRSVAGFSTGGGLNQPCYGVFWLLGTPT